MKIHAFFTSRESLCVSKSFAFLLIWLTFFNSSSCSHKQPDLLPEQMDLETVLTVSGDDEFPVDSYISSRKQDGYFTLAENGNSSSIVISASDFGGVRIVAEHLRTDISRVSGNETALLIDSIPNVKQLVIAGTVGESTLLDQLIAHGKIDLSELDGKWEQFIIQVVDQPFNGVAQALVIAGSDKRGTIYGMYDLAEKIGVSPWYWWADVPIKRHNNLYVKTGRYTIGEPAVKYRGIFINDELPSMENWARETYGDLNSKFYKKVFELILRLKGNYLWPAMWNGKFNVDDSLNQALADEMGIVMGTTHHEPMVRAHKEWDSKEYGEWNYANNEEKLKEFWTGGIERMGSYESIVTLAMRGDGDRAMSEESNITLLQKIVKDQRTIIENVTGKDATETPQLWALYKEVQGYYNEGMRVPDDVTLLLCDDNWGNQRILPKPGSDQRSGGYGIYYHFDFVGGPRNYKWLNTSPISRVWEQMNLAYRHGVDRIWLVNVGDLKPMELPISFFLDFAWNPDNIPAESIPDYHVQWARQQFGSKYAKEIADILMLYTKYNGRRKPEMIAPDTYSLIDYREAETVVKDYNNLAKRAEKIYELIPEVQKYAYYQLVLFPVLACANLNELHFTTGLNHLYADQGRVAANTMATRVEELFAVDIALKEYYHDSLSNGKWNNMMNQTHISYTYWQQPEKDIVPELKTIKPVKIAEMGIAIEGSASWWPNETSRPVLPEFDIYQQQKRYVEIFNRGTEPFDFQIEAAESWISLSKANGTIYEEERIWITVDWSNVPTGFHQIPITISGPDDISTIVFAEVRNPVTPKRDEINGYIEGNGFISIEAVNYSELIESEQIKWQVIPDLGRIGSSITSFPVTTPRILPGGNSPRIEYKINILDTGNVKVMVYVAPTLNIYSTEGLKYAISIDDEEPQIVNIHEGDTIPDWNYPDWWNNAVTQNIKVLVSEHKIDEPGEHTLKYWVVDPAVVLQKIVVVTKDIKQSYLGPPESFRQTIDR